MQVPYKSLPWVSVKPSQEIGVCGFWSPSNSRMSAAKYSGTGAQAASANSARTPAANACANFIGPSELAGSRRISLSGLRPSLIVKHFSLRAESVARLLNKSPARRGPPRPRGSTRGLPGDAAQGGRLISAECRCLIFASRLRTVCPTPDSTGVKFAFSPRRIACSKCDWRAAFAHDELIALMVRTTRCPTYSTISPHRVAVDSALIGIGAAHYVERSRARSDLRSEQVRPTFAVRECL